MLKSMLISDEQKKNDVLDNRSVLTRPDYPPGLKIHLDEKILAMLELNDEVEVGQFIDLKAIVEVTGIRKEGEEKHITLQITSMSLGKEEHEENTSEKLYK